MRLPQFLHEIVFATAVLDATGRRWDWPDDLQVRAGQPDTANAEEAVLIVVDLGPGPGRGRSPTDPRCSAGVDRGDSG